MIAGLSSKIVSMSSKASSNFSFYGNHPLASLIFCLYALISGALIGRSGLEDESCSRMLLRISSAFARSGSVEFRAQYINEIGATWSLIELSVRRLSITDELKLLSPTIKSRNKLTYARILFPELA